MMWCARIIIVILAAVVEKAAAFDVCGIQLSETIEATLLDPAVNVTMGSVSNLLSDFPTEVTITSGAELQVNFDFASEASLCGTQVYLWSETTIQDISWERITNGQRENLLTTSADGRDNSGTYYIHNFTQSESLCTLRMTIHGGQGFYNVPIGLWGLVSVTFFGNTTDVSCSNNDTVAPMPLPPIVSCGERVQNLSQSCVANAQINQTDDTCVCDDDFVCTQGGDCAETKASWASSILYEIANAGTAEANGRYSFTEVSSNTCGIGGIWEKGDWSLKMLSSCSGSWEITRANISYYVSGAATSPPSKSWSKSYGDDPLPIVKAAPDPAAISGNSSKGFSVWIIVLSNVVLSVTSVLLTMLVVGRRRRGRKVKPNTNSDDIQLYDLSRPLNQTVTDPGTTNGTRVLTPTSNESSLETACNTCKDPFFDNSSGSGNVGTISTGLTTTRSIPSSDCDTCRKFNEPLAAHRLSAAHTLLARDLSKPLVINNIHCEHRDTGDHMHMITVENDFETATLVWINFFFFFFFLNFSLSILKKKKKHRTH